MHLRLRLTTTKCVNTGHQTHCESRRLGCLKRVEAASQPGTGALLDEVLTVSAHEAFKRFLGSRCEEPSSSLTSSRKPYARFHKMRQTVSMT